MPLPVPNLDDRRFQDLVDEAKRMVQSRCPEWTDHNVSDPGVTLIETFAYMVDQLLYRLNRVPDRNYVKFLELIGVRLYPPVAAQAPVTFWLSAPQSTDVTVGAGTTVGTLRTEQSEAVVFATTTDLRIVACQLARTATQAAGGPVVDTTDTLPLEKGFACFSDPPRAGDTLLFGLSEPVPSCALELSLSCHVEGIGVDPLDPPLVWEAWAGDGWRRCEVERDTTGGLNRPGSVVLHVPSGHGPSVLAQERAGWIRARVVEPAPNQPLYSASPQLTRASARTVGGTVTASHSEMIGAEVLGLSEGVPGQVFVLQHQPVAALGAPAELEVAGGDGWQRWQQVDSFAGSGPEDRHFVLDEVAGQVILGPAVREPDGSLRHYGAVPAKAAPVRIVAYRCGGGRRGNVERAAISVMKTTVPFVARVENRVAATGGVDAETMDAAKVRGPLLLRTRNRAVTTEDYEHLSRQAAPEVARVRAAEEPGGVRVLVVPDAALGPDGRLAFEQLVPDDATLARIGNYLEARRCVGSRVVVEPPTYQGITVVARLRARRHVGPARLEEDAVAALHRYFNPLIGGPDGRGWPFGRAVHVGDVYAVLQPLEGCETVEEARLYGADPLTGQRGGRTDRLELGANTLVFSFEHQVRAEEGSLA